MEQFNHLITQHASWAHWYLFAAILLAGFNLPFSIDLLILCAAVLAATVIPENTWLIFFSALVGSYISAMCAYWLGRLVGKHLYRWKFFAKLLGPKRLSKIKEFYDKHGLWTLVVGRFIPFGIRNCIFMSSGMSRVHFGKFMLMDGVACSLWCSLSFYLFYTLGKNHSLVWNTLKTFNLIIFAAFGVTVIGVIWYKSRKKLKRC